MARNPFYSSPQIHSHDRIQIDRLPKIRTRTLDLTLHHLTLNPAQRSENRLDCACEVGSSTSAKLSHESVWVRFPHYGQRRSYAFVSSGKPDESPGQRA
jgi:hypothetical protein